MTPRPSKVEHNGPAPKEVPEVVAISEDEFADRVACVRERLGAAGVEVALAYGTASMPGDVQYLTGYDPQLENAALLLTPTELVALGGPEGRAMFLDQACLGTWRCLEGFEIPFQDYAGEHFWSIGELLDDLVGGVPAVIGLLSAPNVLTLELHQKLSQLDPSPRLIGVSDILAEARYHKSPAELHLFRLASSIAADAMRVMLDALKPGMTELEVAAHADYVMKTAGAYNYGFDTIVCSGPRIDTIIGRASNRRIEKGDLVMLGASPRFEGYTSAVGRTIVAGTPTAEQLEFLAHGCHAFELAAEHLVAGRPAREIDLAARRYLASVGLGSYHAYGVGHGIGLSECSEWRTATPQSDYDVPSGVAMMLDVGIFGHPEFYGARHEEPFLVNHAGQTERLTDLRMEVWESRAHA
jgi:Xaa-Pro aminopeptidase